MLEGGSVVSPWPIVMSTIRIPHNRFLILLEVVEMEIQSSFGIVQK